MDKILFLDVDGVLNSINYMKSNDRDKKRLVIGMDASAVQLLKYIVQKTKCKIVVSSSWRIGGIKEGSHFYDELKRTDTSDTILNAVIDHTVKPGCADPSLPKNYVRGHEIQRWIEDNNFTGKFAIIDDDGDMGPVMDHLVKTDVNVGITRSDVQNVIDKLS